MNYNQWRLLRRHIPINTMSFKCLQRQLGDYFQVIMKNLKMKLYKFYMIKFWAFEINLLVI